jgi:hypothetical protein
MGGRRSGLVVLVHVVAGCVAAHAADLIEPWSPGFSDLELHATLDGDGGTSATSTLGFGAGGGFSVGLSLAGGTHSTDVGLVLVWSRVLGRWGELDLFAAADAATGEVELDGLGTSYGLEWSARRRGARPYLRLSASVHDEGRRLHPLVGWNLPLRRCDLHLELSSEQPTPGEPWPLHLAIGPNLGLTEGFELLPELSLVHDRARGGVDITLTLGVVTSPGALAAALRLAER